MGTICHTNANNSNIDVDLKLSNQEQQHNNFRVMVWKITFWTQQTLAKTKLVCSTEYHKQHHFRTEMSNPAILSPVNEFFTSMALHKMKDRKMGPSAFANISKLLRLSCVVM